MKLKFWQKDEEEPKLFELHRLDDFSGISGKGHVLDGVVFPGGQTVIRWRSDNSSIAVFKDLASFKLIHMAQHGRSKLVWRTSESVLGYLYEAAKELNHRFSKAAPEDKKGFLEALKLIQSRATEMEREIDGRQIPTSTGEASGTSNGGDSAKKPPKNPRSAPKTQRKKVPKTTRKRKG